MTHRYQPEEASAAALSIGQLMVLLRPAQWIKNTLVLAALVFSQSLVSPLAIGRALAAFVVFCGLASACYIGNDIADLDRDRAHPLKRRRPLAAGTVELWQAISLGLAITTLALAGAVSLGWNFLFCAGAYLGLQVAYSTWLKHIVIVDVMTIAVGFVIRAQAGGVAIGVEVSPWLVICTFLLALLLATAKRRHEAVLLASDAPAHRAALGEYSERFIDHMISAVTGATVLAYALYTVSPEVRDKAGTEYLYVTFPFAVFGIFRFLYLTFHRGDGGDPTAVLLRDRPLQIAAMLWLATVIVLLYA